MSRPGGGNRVVKRGDLADKDVRALVEHMVTVYGWTWQPGTRGGHGKLYPADRDRQAIIVYNTPNATATHLRRLIRRAGGTPP